MHRGPTALSCRARFGVAGLGRHLAELVGVLDEHGDLARYLSTRPRPQDVGTTGIHVPVPGWVGWASRVPPVRSSMGRRTQIGNIAFDRAAARSLPTSARHLLVFGGHALGHAAVARRLGYESIGIVAANSHMANVVRQHEKAFRQYPLERPWSTSSMGRALEEYQVATEIHVSSHYSWASFVERGYPEERLRLFPLTPHERFAPRPAPSASTFDVVYAGSLSVSKGVPLLVEAIRGLDHGDLRLVLVGGSGTRGMRRFLERSCAEDPRILVRPGDPLPWLLQAGVAVHASYEEGFGYAPAEALACGVPLIVSADTGMADMMDVGTKAVVPTGSLGALREALAAAYQGALRAS